MAKISVEKMRVTPTMAKAWLLKNNMNRPPDKNRVGVFARDMSEKQWAENGETIKFAGDMLIDGQHRLMACVLSDTPFNTLVINGLDPETFNTIDTGKSRTAADTFAVRGEKNYTTLAAALVILHLYYDDKASFTSRLSMYGQATNRTYEEFLERWPEARESVTWGGSHKTPLIPVSIVSACHYIFNQINKADANRFMMSLCCGTNIEPGSPIHRLHGILVENSTSTTKVLRGHMLGMILMAWNAMRTGKNITRLRAIDGVKYPEAV